MLNPLPLLWADMQRTRSGVIALICLIALAVALGVAVSAQERALRSGSNQAAAPFDLIVGAPGSETQLLMSTVYLQPASVDLLAGQLLNDLSNDPGVKFAAPIAFGDSYQAYPIIGSSAQFAILDGERPVAEGRVFNTLSEAVIGADVRLALGTKFHPKHGQIALDEDDEDDENSVHQAIEYQVVGRLPRWASPWDRAIIVPVEAVWRSHGLATGHRQNQALLRAVAEHKTGTLNVAEFKIGPPWDSDFVPGVPAIVLKPNSIRDAYILRTRLRNDDATMAFFPAEVLLELYVLLGDARTLFATMAVATQVLVIAAILLAVFAALALRRRQIGVLRALGASRFYIFSVIWCYIVVIIALGAALGLFLGWLLASVLSTWVGQQTGLLLAVSLSSKEVMMAAVLLVIGFILAAIPSITIYRTSVSALLRH